MCRKTLSFHQLSKTSRTGAVDGISDRGLRRFNLIHQYAALFLRERRGTQRSQRDLLALAFKLNGVSGAEMKLFPERLEDHDASGLIKSDLSGHSGNVRWENPTVKPSFLIAGASPYEHGPAS